MEFWGVEVKAGQPLKATPGFERVLHLSQASLGETKKDKGNESALLFVKIGDQKLVLGTLSSEKFPQITFDLVFEKEFELSHNWKNGSVYFCGYISATQEPEDGDDFSDLNSDSEEEFPLISAENGKSVVKVEDVKPAVAKANAVKPESSAKPKVKLQEPSKVVKSEEEDDDDEDDEDDDEDDEDEDMSDVDSSDEDVESDEEDEETPKKVELSKKRPSESATKTPVPAKKAKPATPQKTGAKTGGHTATPHPSKKAGKTPNGDKSKPQTPKSGGQFSCKSCNKTFGSEGGLDSHSKAKHAAGK